MRGIILFSHGSVLSGAERNLLELAARMRERGDAAIVEVAFLNYTEPDFATAVARCVEQGATRIVIAPYFLIAGKFVVEDLPATIASVRSRYPEVTFETAGVIGFHPALATAVLASASAAGNGARSSEHARKALLIMAHGSPRPEANEDVLRVAELLRSDGGYARVTVGYLDCNEPDIATALDECVAAGVTAIAAVPYFLHSGKHFLHDVPAILKEGELRHPGVMILMGDYVGRQPQIAEVLLDRVRATGFAQSSSDVTSSS